MCVCVCVCVAVWDYVQVGGQSACLLTGLTAVGRQCHSCSDTEPSHDSSSGQNFLGFGSLAVRPRHLLTLCQDVLPNKAAEYLTDSRALIFRRSRCLVCASMYICMYVCMYVYMYIYIYMGYAVAQLV